MTFTIRQAKIDDAPFLVKAEQEVANEPGFLCSQPFELSELKVQHTIASLNGIYLVAENQGQIVGHAFLEQLPLQSLRHVADLTICVHKGHQDKGIGTKLMERLIAWAKQSNEVEKIELKVRSSNARAIALYKKMGFHEEGRLEKRIKIGNRYIDDILMALHVKAAPVKSGDAIYHLEHHNSMPRDYETILYQGISDEAFLAKRLPPIRPFSIVIKDQKQNILGGVCGTLFYGSLYVDTLWIDTNLRRQGWGTKLMNEAEKAGKEHGALFATLNTMDWEALIFYQKLGYCIEFTREGYKKDSKMFMLRKNL